MCELLQLLLDLLLQLLHLLLHLLLQLQMLLLKLLLDLLLMLLKKLLQGGSCQGGVIRHTIKLLSGVTHPVGQGDIVWGRSGQLCLLRCTVSLTRNQYTPLPISQ